MISAAQFARRFALLAFGFSWGAVLLYAAMYMTASGHGTYIPFALATAPLSLGPLLFGNRHTFWGMIFAVPFWWTLMMLLSGIGRGFRYLWAVFIALHYSTAILIMYRTDFAYGLNGRAFRGMLHIRPAWTIGTLLLYAIGQSIMWHEFFVTRHVPVAGEASLAPPVPVPASSPDPDAAVPLEAVPEVAPSAGDVEPRPASAEEIDGGR